MTLPQLPNNFRPTVPQVPSFESELGTIRQNLSAAGKIKEQIMEAAIPDNLFNISGSLDQIEEDINEKVDSYIEGVQIPTIPQLSLAGILSKFMPQIPVVTIPSPAEIRQYVNQRIELKKIRQQQQIIKKLEEDANLEETPFTARQEAENKTKNSSLINNLSRRINL